MTHGFDDQGRNYDKNGNLADWWTPEDAALFTERADRLVQQYDYIIVADSVHANGRYTLGENIADQGGLGKWRVNAALRNIDTFYSAFDIKEGDPMYMLPAERVVIW